MDEELRLLRAFWDLYWNGPGSVECTCQPGGASHSGAEAVALDDAASAVEDHYAKTGTYPEEGT